MAHRSHPLVVVVLAALAGMATPVRADDAACEPDWQRGISMLPGIDGPVKALLEFDDATFANGRGGRGGRGDGVRAPALYAGGNFRMATSVAVKNVARFDGVAWSAVGPADGDSADGEIVAFAALPAGDERGALLVAGGTFTKLGGVAASHVASFDGSTWSPLGPGLVGEVRDLAIFDDGTGPALFAGGSGPGGTVEGSFVARWDGTTWQTIGVFNNIVRALEVFDDGAGPALAVGGSFTSVNGMTVYRLARWNGAAWSEIGGGVNNRVSQLAAFDDGTGPKLCASGLFTIAGGVPVQRVASWNGRWWSPMQSFFSEPTALASIDLGAGPVLHVAGSGGSVGRWTGSAWDFDTIQGGLDGAVLAFGHATLDGADRLVVGGGFEHRYVTRMTSVAALGDDNAWKPVPRNVPGLGVDMRAGAMLAREEDGELALYVAGDFTQAGEVSTRGIARWNGEHWSALDGGLGGFTVTVSDLVEFDDGSGPALYVGGIFSTAGRVETNGLARWDGMHWSSIGSVLGSSPYVIAMKVVDLGDGPRLCIAGRFTSVGGVAANNIALWDGTTWSALGAGMPGETYALEVFDDGGGPAIYAGSYLLRRWNGSTWQTVVNSIKLASGSIGYATALLAIDDERGPALVVGGQFATLDGVPVNLVGRWDGTRWTSWGDGLAGGVAALRMHDDGSGPALFIGGSLTIGAQQHNLLKRVDGELTTVGGGVESTANLTRVAALATLPQHRLAVGGGFHRVAPLQAPDDFEVSHVAIWGATGLAWITRQPHDTTVDAGESVVLSAHAIVDDARAAIFQWRHDDVDLTNGDNIGGATSDTLVLAHASAADAGVYTLAVTTACGEVVTDAAFVTVRCAGDIDGDGAVGSGDLGLLLGAWGGDLSSADLDGDGVIGPLDLSLLLAAWGACR